MCIWLGLFQPTAQKKKQTKSVKHTFKSCVCVEIAHIQSNGKNPLSQLRNSSGNVRCGTRLQSNRERQRNKPKIFSTLHFYANFNQIVGHANVDMCGKWQMYLFPQIYYDRLNTTLNANKCKFFCSGINQYERRTEEQKSLLTHKCLKLNHNSSHRIGSREGKKTSAKPKKQQTPEQSYTNNHIETTPISALNAWLCCLVRFTKTNTLEMNITYTVQNVIEPWNNTSNSSKNSLDTPNAIVNEYCEHTAAWCVRKCVSGKNCYFACMQTSSVQCQTITNVLTANESKCTF